MSRPLKVLYLVSPSPSFAGIERVVHEVADALATGFDDLDIHVAYCSRYPELEQTTCAYTTHVLGIGRLFEMLRPVRRLVREERFDVVVAPQVEATVLTWAATRGLGAALVAHVHGNPIVEEREGTLRTRLCFRAFRYLVRGEITSVFTVSESLARHVQTLTSARVPVTYVPNPVRDLAAEPQRPLSASHFVCVARLSYQKGQDVLLKAFAEALPRIPGATLTLAGSGPDEELLRKLAHNLGLDDSIEFVGFVSDPSPFLARASCFVMASRWEGFGVALVEALQFGLPILATECDFGPADIIVNESIGELVPPENHLALADAIVTAAQREWNSEDAATRRSLAASHLPAAVATHHYSALIDAFARSRRH